MQIVAEWYSFVTHYGAQPNYCTTIVHRMIILVQRNAPRKTQTN
ncbi:hypothetical protein MTsN2n6_25570 [Vibrio fortis]